MTDPYYDTRHYNNPPNLPGIYDDYDDDDELYEPDEDEEDEVKEEPPAAALYEYRSRAAFSSWGPWRPFLFKKPYGLGTHVEFEVREKAPFVAGYFQAQGAVTLEGTSYSTGAILFLREEPLHPLLWRRVKVVFENE